MQAQTVGLGNYSGPFLGYLGEEETGGQWMDISVRGLQCALNQAGYRSAQGARLNVDGNWDSETQQAMESFRRAEFSGQYAFLAPRLGTDSVTVRVSTAAIARLARLAPNCGLPSPRVPADQISKLPNARRDKAGVPGVPGKGVPGYPPPEAYTWPGTVRQGGVPSWVWWLVGITALGGGGYLMYSASKKARRRPVAANRRRRRKTRRRR